MKQVWFDNRFISNGSLVDEVAEVLGMDDFKVELFGADINDEHLPDTYTIVGYNSRDTYVVCENGELLDEEDIKEKENKEYIMQEYPVYDHTVDAYYEVVKDLFENYDYDAIDELMNKLLAISGDNIEADEERLKELSQYYNMKAICEKAGINYDTYRGWKNRGLSLSAGKIKHLLVTMHFLTK